MDKLFGTTTVIDEARMTVKKRSFLTITVVFLIVYFIGSMISSMLLMLPMYGVIFTNDGFMELMESSNDYNAIYAELDRILASEMPEWMNAASLIATVGIIICAIYYCTRMERRRFFTLGFVKKGAIIEYVAGLIIGLAMFGLAYGIIILSGQAEFIGFNSNISVWMLLLFFVGFLIQGMSEEILLRGYYLVSAATGGNIPLAVFASSAAFALFHLGNSGVSIMAVLNIFLFGLFAALYFIRRGNIWGIAAIHSMWNFAQGNIFGCEVSGNNMGSSIIETVQVGSNTMFNGGAFGPEGGLGVTIVLFVGIVILLFMKNKSVEPEINFSKEFQSA